MNIKGMVAYVIGPLVSAVLGLVVVPVTAWLFRPEDVGRLSLLQVVSNFVIVMFCLGLDQAYVREYHGSIDKPATLMNAGVPGIGATIIVMALAFIFSPGLLSWLIFSVDSKIVSVAVAFCVLASMINRFGSLVLRMQERGYTYSFAQILPKLLFLFATGLVATGIFPRSFQFLVIAQSAAVCATTAAVMFAIRDAWLPAFPVRLSSQQISTMLRFGAPLAIGGVASWGLGATDRILLRGLASFQELAIYSVALSATAGITIFAGIINTVWTPIAYKWESQGDEMCKIVPLSRYLLGVVALSVSAAGLASGLVASILPYSYSSIKFILPCCVLAPLMYTLSEVTGIGIGLSRKSIYSMTASLLAVTLNAGVGYIAIERWGARGAAVSTMLAYFGFFTFRTEFSVLVWRAISRAIHYWVLTLLGLCCAAYAFCGSYAIVEWNFLWAGLLLLFSFAFWKELRDLVRYMSRGIQRYTRCRSKAVNV